MKLKLYQIIYVLALLLIPLLQIIFINIYLDDPDYYFMLTWEDGILQSLSFVFLALASVLSLWMAIRLRKGNIRHWWFFVAFSIFCLFCALEEISWGQNMLEIESPQFFIENSDQQEINVHNVLQKWYQIKTKHVAGLVLFVYGVLLPVLVFNDKIKHFFKRIGFFVPPGVLCISFLIGAVMMLDQPTGDEEEIGEFFFSLCFFLWMLLEHLKIDGQPQTE